MTRRNLRILALVFIVTCACLWITSCFTELSVRRELSGRFDAVGVIRGRCLWLTLTIFPAPIGKVSEIGHWTTAQPTVLAATAFLHHQHSWAGFSYVSADFNGVYYRAIPLGFLMLLVAVPLAWDLWRNRRKRGRGFPVVPNQRSDNSAT